MVPRCGENQLPTSSRHWFDHRGKRHSYRARRKISSGFALLSISICGITKVKIIYRIILAQRCPSIKFCDHFMCIAKKKARLTLNSDRVEILYHTNYWEWRQFRAIINFESNEYLFPLINEQPKAKRVNAIENRMHIFENIVASTTVTKHTQPISLKYKPVCW